MHARRLLRHGDPHTIIINRQKPGHCVIEGCDKRHNARGLCKSHYMAELRRGGYRWNPDGTEPRGVKDNTECHICGDTPMGGGKFCYPHFMSEIVERNRALSVA